LTIYDICIVTLLGFITILSDTFRCLSNSILSFTWSSTNFDICKIWYCH